MHLHSRGTAKVIHICGISRELALYPKESQRFFRMVDMPHQVNFEEGIGGNVCYPGEPPNHDC